LCAEPTLRFSERARCPEGSTLHEHVGFVSRRVDRGQTRQLRFFGMVDPSEKRIFGDFERVDPSICADHVVKSKGRPFKNPNLSAKSKGRPFKNRERRVRIKGRPFENRERRARIKGRPFENRERRARINGRPSKKIERRVRSEGSTLQENELAARARGQPFGVATATRS
jgi:hypothetical protein